ncbi:MAG: hypothetical protein V1882_10150 [Candidatus Omnitrophota bacterium]
MDNITLKNAGILKGSTVPAYGVDRIPLAILKQYDPRAAAWLGAAVREVLGSFSAGLRPHPEGKAVRVASPPVSFLLRVGSSAGNRSEIRAQGSIARGGFKAFFAGMLAWGLIFLNAILPVSAHAVKLGFAWTANPPPVAGYKIYWGTNGSRNYTDSKDVGNVTTADLSGFTAGVTYWFAATAYYAQSESGYSDEVVAVMPSGEPTVSPLYALTNLSAYPLSGTKPSQSSLWINGVEMVPLDALTTWSVPAYALTVGMNVLSIFTKDASGVASSPVQTTITLDTIVPTGSININSGSGYASSTAVTLNLSGVGASTMSFSNDSVTWTPAEPYAATKSYTLAQGDGAKPVYAKFYDAAGNVSPVYSAWIVLDTIAPAVAVTSAAVSSASSYVLSYTVDGVTKSRNETLAAGDNVLRITETDAAGNQTVVDFHVQYVPATQVVKVTDDFNRAFSVDIGTQWQVVSGTFRIENQQLWHDAATNVTSGMVIMKNPLVSTDYEVKADFEFRSSPAGDMDRGLIADYQDIGNYYYGQYSRVDGKYRIIKVQNGVSTVLAEAVAPAISNWVYREIKLRRSNARLELYISGSLVLQAHDSTFSGGRVGIYSGSGNFGHSFDNFSLQQWQVTAPAVAGVPAYTNLSSIPLSGTKSSNTSVWINGVQVVPLNALMTWSVPAYPLTEGVNGLSITARDTEGHESAPVQTSTTLQTPPPTSPTGSSGVTPDAALSAAGSAPATQTNTTAIPETPALDVLYRYDPSGRALTFTDSFNRTTGPGNYWQVMTGSFSTSVQTLFHDAGGSATALIVLTEPLVAATYEVKAAFEFTGKAADADRGVIADLQDSENYYYGQYSRASGKYRILLVRNGVRTVLAEVEAPEIPDGVFREIKIVKTGFHMDLYFDKALALQVEDATFSGGWVGVYSGSASHAIDDFSLVQWPLAAPVVAQAPFLTSQNFIELSGTKPAYSAIWNNGQEFISPDGSTTWAALFHLPVEGENPFSFTARDSYGVESFPFEGSVIRNSLAPVLAVTSPTVSETADYALRYTTLDGTEKARDVTLELGDNLLNITEPDASGSLSVLQYPVRYDLPTWVVTFTEAGLASDLEANWQAADGTLEVDTQTFVHEVSNTGADLAILQKPLESLNYDIMAEFQFLDSAAEDMDRGLIVDYQDIGNYYYGQYSRVDAKYRIIKVQNGVSTVLAEAAAPAIPDGVTREILLKRSSAQLELFFNGAQVLQAEDATFMGGWVGVYSGSASQTFDNFSLYQRVPVRSEMRTRTERFDRPGVTSRSAADLHRNDPVIAGRVMSSIPVAVAAERTLKPGLLLDLESLILGRLRAIDAQLARMPRLAQVMARLSYDRVLRGVFPERFEAKSLELQEHVIASVMKETSLSRQEVLHLAESLLATPAATEKTTHATIFIPIADGLSVSEQEDLFETAVREARSFPGKAVIFVTSEKMPAALFSKIESQSDGRVAVLDGVKDPVGFMAGLFDTGQKLSPQARKKVHGSVQKAAANAFGRSGTALRNMARHSLALAAPQVFEMPQGMIRQISQQFLFRGEGGVDPAAVYDAYLRYAIRIGGHTKAADIDERLRENLLIRDDLPGRPGITEISFTAQGLNRVVSFLKAIANARQIQISA